MRIRFWLATTSVLALAATVSLWAPRSAGAAPDEPKPAVQPKKEPKPAAGADVFAIDKVWQFHLTVSAAEYAAMQPAQVGFGFPKGPNPPPKVEPKPGEPKRETHRSAFNVEFPWVE